MQPTAMDAKRWDRWAHRQGFDGSLAGAGAADVLELTGWARAVGGAARGFSPDSPKSRVPRIEALRAAAAE